MWVDDPHFNLAYHVRHTALPRPGGDDAAQAPRRPRLLAGARPQPAAVGAVAGRGARAAIASRCSPRPTTRSSTASPASTSRRVLFDTSPEPGAGRAARARVGAAAAAERARSCWPTRCSSAPPCRPRSCAASAPRCAARAGSRARPGEALGRRRRAGAGRPSARAAEPVQRADRSAPPLHLGRRRPRRVQGDQERARRDGQRRRAGRRRRRARAATCARTARYRRRRAQGDGAGLGPQPTSSAARSATAWPRCGRRCPSGSTDPVERLQRDQRGDGRDQGVRPGGGRPGADRAAGFAPPTIMAQAARLQARQRMFNLVVTNVPGTAAPAVRAGSRARGDVPDGAAGREHRARDRNHELQRPDELRPQRRTTTRCRTSESLADDLRASIDELAAAAGGLRPGTDRVAPRLVPLGERSARLESKPRDRSRSLERVAIVVVSLRGRLRADRAAVGILRRTRPGRRVGGSGDRSRAGAPRPRCTHT